MGYSESEAINFISRMAPMIKAAGNKRGYAIVSTTIAQAIIEGAAGTSTLAKAYHNHFGMKAEKNWRGKVARLRTKEEYKKGELVTIYDNFRAYPTDEACIQGYYDFISTKRYANLKNAVDYRQFAEYLKKDGYATSSTYVNSLCKTVEKYSLFNYDNKADVKSLSQIAHEVIDGKWGNGEERKKKLTTAGYDYKEVQKIVNSMV